MPNSSDPTADMLLHAPLTPAQREAWETMRKALAESRAKAEDLEKRLKALEENPPEDQNSILNRAEFNREVARMLAYDERYGGMSSIVYLDIENMDGVVTQYGKSVANAALRDASDALMKNIRGSDVIGRLAPNEFGVLLVRCENANAWKKGNDLATLLTNTLAEVHSCKLNVAVKYGAYTFRSDEDVSSGLKHASQMLKRAGT